MDLMEILASNTTSKLVLPCTGKMFYDEIKGIGNSDKVTRDKVLVVPLNKGYFESEDLGDILNMLDSQGKNKLFITVGNTVKIKRADGTFCYRQRIFINDLYSTLKACAEQGYTLHIPSDFKVPIISILNNLADMPYLETYANMHNQVIDGYLRKVILIQLYFMSNVIGIKHNLTGRIKRWQKRPVLKGILNNTPFLCSRIGVGRARSSIFIDIDDWIASGFCTNAEDYGYTATRIKKHRKEGLFNANTFSTGNQGY